MEQFDRDQLARLEAVWNAEHLNEAVVEAITYCARRGLPSPLWAVAALRYLVPATPNRGKGKPSRRQSMKHYTRWSAVEEAREELGVSWDEAYQRASDILKDTDAAGSPAVIKRSYLIVAKDFRNGITGRYWLGNDIKLRDQD
jgi:hypothetical protein